MKKNEEMNDTNRMALMLEFGGKIYIDKKNIDGTDQYIVSTNDIDLSAANIGEFDTLVFKNMNFSEDSIRIKLIVIHNMVLRTIYFNNEGYIDEYIGSYSPLLEENTYSKEISFNIDNVVEICTDLEMFNEMKKSKLVDGDSESFAKYGLYYPTIGVVKNKTCKK